MDASAGLVRFGQRAADSSSPGDSRSYQPASVSATVSMGMEVGGEIQDLPFPMEMDLPSDTVEGTGQFECTDETLMVTPPPKARTARS